MPLEIGNVINGGAAWLCSSPFINRYIRNPIFTALLLTALVLIIFAVMTKQGEDLHSTQLYLKLGFWLGLAIMGVVFVHYYAHNFILCDYIWRFMH